VIISPQLLLKQK